MCDHRRDFTYIDDIIECVVRTMEKTPTPDPEWSGALPDPATSRAPWRMYNISNNRSVELMRYIAVIEECFGKKTEKTLLPIQSGDVPETYADASALMADVGYKPENPIGEGVRSFIDWYRDYYRVRILEFGFVSWFALLKTALWGVWYFVMTHG